ncbi:MAG: sulfurtransferase TusA family protein [Candidatus Aminicenantales bacterium]|jgi:tRNA 2-thiouridine synthesizing protein A
MTEEELRNLRAEKIVDARGTSCPGPLLAAKRSIIEVPVGGIMELLSSDTGTKRDVPLWANKMGHEFLGTIEEAGYSRIFVKRAK